MVRTKASERTRKARAARWRQHEEPVVDADVEVGDDDACTAAAHARAHCDRSRIPGHLRLHPDRARIARRLTLTLRVAALPDELLRCKPHGNDKTRVLQLLKAVHRKPTDIVVDKKLWLCDDCPKTWSDEKGILVIQPRPPPVQLDVETLALAELLFMRRDPRVLVVELARPKLALPPLLLMDTVELLEVVEPIGPQTMEQSAAAPRQDGKRTTPPTVLTDNHRYRYRNVRDVRDVQMLLAALAQDT